MRHPITTLVTRILALVTLALVPPAATGLSITVPALGAFGTPPVEPVEGAARVERGVWMAQGAWEPIEPLPGIAPNDPLVIEVVEGDIGDERLVEDAHELLRRAGLELPALVVTVDRSGAACRGHDGLYRSDGSAHRIGVCTVTEIVVLHELAHAWDHTTLSDADRDRFLAHTGLESWSDPDIEWKRRGTERSANTVAIALGSGGIGCSGSLAEAYEVLTGSSCRLSS